MGGYSLTASIICFIASSGITTSTLYLPAHKLEMRFGQVVTGFSHGLNAPNFIVPHFKQIAKVMARFG